MRQGNELHVSPCAISTCTAPQVASHRKPPARDCRLLRVSAESEATRNKRFPVRETLDEQTQLTGMGLGQEQAAKAIDAIRLSSEI